jgi:predicted anti-sigma-YlaC factor YlaD
MTCEELAELLPDLMDGTVAPELQAEAEEALARCPECRQELEAARQIRALLVRYQSQALTVQLSPQFEARLLTRLRRQKHGLALIDFSSRSFGLWLVEVINILGHLFAPPPQNRVSL